MHALKLLLALQGTVATCKARFGGLSDVNVSLQSSSDMCLLKIIKFGWHLAKFARCHPNLIIFSRHMSEELCKETFRQGHQRTQ